MEETKELNKAEEDISKRTAQEDAADDGEKTLAPEASSKSKKKKKKSKLKTLLERKPNEETTLAEVEEAMGSTSLEERKFLTKEEQLKLDMVIKKLSEKIPGGRKDIADHKFWKTQPVIKFGMARRGCIPHNRRVG